MDWLVHVDGAEELRQLSPDFPSLARLPGRGWIITSGSDDPRYDFLSRFFGPSVGIDEDSVTGSAHCCLVSYWSEILSKSKLVGYQASRRGGVVTVESHGSRAILSGHAALVFSGHCHASWR
jgi:predicted PhzF superfamily epimerase YddE/YHI9